MSEAPFYPGDGTAFEAFEAERVHLYVTNMLSDYPGLAASADLKAMRTHAVEATVLQMTAWCVAGRIPDSSYSETIEWPDGVWQMFKSKFMPHWLVRRWPVRMHQVEVTKTVNHYFVCPHLVTDPQSRHVQFMATGTRIAQWMRP